MTNRKALRIAAFLSAVAGASILSAPAASAASPERKFCDFPLAKLPEATCHDEHQPKSFGEKVPVKHHSTPYTS